MRNRKPTVARAAPPVLSCPRTGYFKPARFPPEPNKRRFGYQVAETKQSAAVPTIGLPFRRRWISSRGLLDRAALTEVPNDLAPEEINQFAGETLATLGKLRQLAPIAQLSETKAY